MNRITILVLSLMLVCATAATAQDGLKQLPQINIKTMANKNINTASFENDGNPIVVSFWATWCKPCVSELTAMAELYDQWQKETGVKIIAVSIDDARNMAKVAPFVNGKDWYYEVYIDPNSDFRRSMNVNVIPHTFLLNSEKEIVWQHNSYAPGDELKLYENIKKLKEGKPITE